MLFSAFPFQLDTLRARKISLHQLLLSTLCLAGFLLLIDSCRKGWFAVPMGGLGSDFQSQLISVEPNCAPFFRWVVAVLVGLLMILRIRSRCWTWSCTTLAGCLLITTLAFPYGVMICSPNVSATASHLQMQFDHLTWLGGDIFLNAEQSSMCVQETSYFVDIPRQLNTVRLPAWSPWQMGFEKWGDLLDWLGYSQAFCQFVGIGWTQAVVGSLFILLSTTVVGGQMVLQRVEKALGGCVLAAILGSTVAWYFPFAAAQQIQNASQFTTHGEFQKALDSLELAVGYLPVLAHDTNYIAQRGLLESHLDHLATSPYALLYGAIATESTGRYDQAYPTFESLAQCDQAAVAREAQRALLRYAIQDYNSMRFRLALQRMEYLLRLQPSNPKLVYMLQLAGLRENSRHRVYAMCEQMISIAEYFHFGTKKILCAVSQQNAMMVTAAQASDASAQWSRALRAKQP